MFVRVFLEYDYIYKYICKVLANRTGSLVSETNRTSSPEEAGSLARNRAELVTPRGTSLNRTPRKPTAKTPGSRMRFLSLRNGFEQRARRSEMRFFSRQKRIWAQVKAGKTAAGTLLETYGKTPARPQKARCIFSASKMHLDSDLGRGHRQGRLLQDQANSENSFGPKPDKTRKTTMHKTMQSQTPNTHCLKPNTTVKRREGLLPQDRKTTPAQTEPNRTAA